MSLTKIQVKKTFVFASLIIFVACGDNASREPNQSTDSVAAKGTYAYDAAFLKKHNRQVLELQDANGQGKILLSADYQGRVMTSTAMGDSGTSFGWLNYDLIAAGANKKQFNPVGGEERFWMGPEGGQYSIYFKKGDSFNIANWQVPAIIDTIPFDVVSHDQSQAVFKKTASITNYSGTTFDIEIQRTIKLVDLRDRFAYLVPSSDTVSFVAYQTENQIKNVGPTDWTKENGLLSIWLLCMMTPTEQTTAIIPFHADPNARQYITDNYFGKVPPERLRIKDSVIYFTCDGKKRSKIGIAPAIAKQSAGSYDSKLNVLTVIHFNVEKNGLYVNSKWELQKQPFKGDAVNSYNDGPLEDGSQLGPFYELESSSPATALKRGEVQQYVQSTVHFQGNFSALSKIAKQLLGVDLNELKK
jgi:hypothetical protein